MSDPCPTALILVAFALGDNSPQGLEVLWVLAVILIAGPLRTVPLPIVNSSIEEPSTNTTAFLQLSEICFWAEKIY